MSTSADADTFERAVVERSWRLPVVVDFWAPWCGPCRQLTPALERVAERYAGQVELVKVNVDEAPEVARRYQVSGIPAVKAFLGGVVASELTGAQPEQSVERFFAALVPSQADRLTAQAGDEPDPEPLLRQALQAEPGHAGASVTLARLLAARGDVDEALALLDTVPTDAEAGRLRAELRLAGAQSADVDTLRGRVVAGDADARVELGRALAGQGHYEEALAELLAAVRLPEVREAARKAVLEVFEVLGDDHELVRSSRPRLASSLYA